MEGPRDRFTDVSADACDGATAIILLDFAQANLWLPAGYHARDAQGLLGFDVSTGKAAAFVAALDCDRSVWSADGLQVAFVAFFVEPPVLAGERPPVQYDFYQPATFADAAFAAALAADGWRAQPANVSVQLDVFGAGGTATASSGNGTATQFSLIAVAPAPVPDDVPGIGFQDWGLRFWHDLPAGTGYLEYRFSLDVPVGPVACTFPQGSPVREFIGQPGCPGLPPEAEGANPSLAALFPGLAFDGAWAFLPGVHAA